jgi:hypothetical protein
LESFSYELQFDMHFYMHSYLHKIFILVKSGCYSQAASATALMRKVLKAGPLCRQRILDPKKISAMALNSTRPRRGTSLILYRGAVVMPRFSSKAQSLPARIRDSASKDSTLSASRYIFSGSVSLGGGCSSSVLSSVPLSSGCCSSAGES